MSEEKKLLDEFAEVYRKMADKKITEDEALDELQELNKKRQALKEAESPTGEKEKPPDPLSAETLLLAHKVSLAKKITSGKTGLTKELEKLLEFEKRLAEQTQSSAESSGNGEEPLGIPDEFKIKRGYTMSPAAREARSKGGKTLGKRNNFKNGKFAPNYILNKIKPCLSTCKDFRTCSLIEAGKTEPGGICLDKAEVMEFFQAIHKAVKEGQFDDFNELSSLMTAESMKLLQDSLQAVQMDGGVVMSKKYNDLGIITSKELKAHPLMLVLPKLIQTLNMTPFDLNITKHEKAKQKTDEDGIKSIAGMMSNIVGKSLLSKEEPDKKDTGDD